MLCNDSIQHPCLVESLVSVTQEVMQDEESKLSVSGPTQRIRVWWQRHCLMPELFQHRIRRDISHPVAGSPCNPRLTVRSDTCQHCSKYQQSYRQQRHPANQTPGSSWTGLGTSIQCAILFAEPCQTLRTSISDMNSLAVHAEQIS